MREHYSGYNPDKAPAVLMPKELHDLTRAVYNKWRSQMKEQMGGEFGWGKVPEKGIRDLGEGMFEASKVPMSIRQGYWNWFGRMKEALTRDKASGQ
jgi:hypothetical protein